MKPHIKLSNSLTRQKEIFDPIDPGHVRLYACGPTVYNYAHIGNARMAVVFDVLTRLLKQIYPKVTYVSNITDVDDKIIAAMQSTGQSAEEITRKYEAIYNEDMAAIGVSAPDIQPRATEHIGEMIALIEKLITQDHAYEADGHVLFHVPSFPEYGGLSGRSRDEQIAGARVEVASYKKDPADFVLWKPSSDDEPGWDSPWGPNNGRGRPGWHIECSAMAEKHLELPFDIHGGGADLKFPHHENEIAQSCCAHGTENDLSSFAKYWVHNGFVTVEGEKMSKSLGNVTLVHDLIQDHKGEVIRLTLLSAQYSQPLDWSLDKLTQSAKALDKFYRKIEGVPGDVEIDETVMDALCDDLCTPRAIAALHAIEDPATLKASANLLGLLTQKPSEWFGTQESDDAIDTLLGEREEAKASKNWARADEIRDQLKADGIMIEDTPNGPKWKKI